MREISFRLAAPLKLPNRRSLGRNWQAAAAVKAEERRALAWEVRAAIGAVGEPIRHCTVQVWRHGIQAPDVDNRYAALKPLLDLLQPSGPKRSYGLGVIASDAPSLCYPRIHHVQARRRSDQCTQVVIREVSEAMFYALTINEAA